MTDVSEQSVAQHTPGPWSWETPMGEHCPWIVQAGKQAYEWEPIATLGDCTEDGPNPRSKAFKTVQADARLIAAAPDLLNGCNALLGLLQLLANRDDINDEVRACLTSGHRIDEAKAAALLAAPRAGEGVDAFPQPQRRDGKEPCGECRLREGETCDICGASA